MIDYDRDIAARYLAFSDWLWHISPVLGKVWFVFTIEFPGLVVGAAGGVFVGWLIFK